MPLAKLEILKGHSMEHKTALFDCVRDGLFVSLSVPKDNCTMRIYELDEWHFERTPGKTDNFTLIKLTLMPGRSAKLKRDAIVEITRLLGERLNIAPADVFIIINELPLENWGFRGLQASELGMQYRKE